MPRSLLRKDVWVKKYFHAAFLERICFFVNDVQEQNVREIREAALPVITGSDPEVQGTFRSEKRSAESFRTSAGKQTTSVSGSQLRALGRTRSVLSSFVNKERHQEPQSRRTLRPRSLVAPVASSAGRCPDFVHTKPHPLVS